MESLKSLGFDPGVLFINIVGFIVLVWFVARYLYRPIAGFMEERTREIEGHITEAKQLNELAQKRHEELQDELQTEREATRAEIARMAQEAKAAIAEMHAQGRRERQELIEQGQREIERSKDMALAELKRTVSELAVEISGKVIRESLDEARQEALIDQFLRDVEQAAREQRAG